jgi:hypothetical protein
MSYDVAALGKICLCDIASGAVEDHAVDGWHGQETFSAGEVFLFAPPDRPYPAAFATAIAGSPFRPQHGPACQPGALSHTHQALWAVVRDVRAGDFV